MGICVVPYNGFNFDIGFGFMLRFIVHDSSPSSAHVELYGPSGLIGARTVECSFDGFSEAGRWARSFMPDGNLGISTYRARN